LDRICLVVSMRGRRAAHMLCTALAIALCGCLLRDSKLVEDSGVSSRGGRDAAPVDAGPSPDDGSQARAGGESGAAPTGGATAREPRAGTGGTSGTPEMPSGGKNADGGSGGQGSNAPAPDVCADSVCDADYPCQKLDSGYTCRGQFADWSPAYSASAFMVTDGTVKDSRSGLIWQQMVPTSYAPACSGKYNSSSTAGDACTWQDAKKYCAGLSLAGGGWRLPTKAELESLVDDSRVDPAIDLSAFPGTPARDVAFWSSSADVRLPEDRAWYVYFGTGFSDYFGVSDALHVRCVR
jgi:hypothetical protein